ncbi:hypothetical protein AHAS_Ahas13G0317500 [Arachis hypogaea]
MTRRRSRASTSFDSEPKRTFLRLRREARGKKVVGAEEKEEFFETNMEDNMENHHEEEDHNHGEGGRANHAGKDRRVLGSYINPNPGNCRSSIQKPTIHANNFELKPQLITLVQNNCSFGGGVQEDPNQHLTTFLRICDTVKSNGVHPDAYRLLLFPFSLRDKAAKLRVEVQTFRQQDGETLYEAWERFKDLTRRCPPDMFNEWVQLHIFYEGLSYESKKAIDHSSGGSLNKKKTIEEAIDVIETVAENDYFYASKRGNTIGVMELNNVDALLAQNKLITQQLADLTKKMETNQVAAISTSSTTQEGVNEEAQGSQEQANYNGNSPRKNYDPYSKTYNPGWRNHPNFGWGSEQDQNQD